MEIKQFYDKALAQASYAVLSENEIALIDPSRDPKAFYDFAREKNAKIVAVIETHPHADFVSSHLEISKTTGAKIYVSSLYNPLYDYIPFDEGSQIKIGKILLSPINTPGHSPDSISILIKDENGNDYALATGDTLLVGDVGRPDLRESAGSVKKAKEDLARMMYHTIHEKLLKLGENIIVYPAHGAGSLCGKSTSKDTFTSIGKEKRENYAFQNMSESDFIKELLKDQSYVPKYFAYNVDLNTKGAPDFEASIKNVRRINSYDEIKDGEIIIDTRNKDEFSREHKKGAMNLSDGSKFETWLGSIVSPEEKFYLIAASEENLDKMMRRTAKIGYEANIKGALIHSQTPGLVKSETLDTEHFKNNLENFTILDVRTRQEVEQKKIFNNAVAIPLNELRERSKEIPDNKPVVVHCEGGYRSAIASSMIEELLRSKVYDLGEAIRSFSKN